MKKENDDPNLPANSPNANFVLVGDDSQGPVAATAVHDELDASFEDGEHGQRTRSRIEMFCFHCNRPEKHILAMMHRWYYSFLTGLTFGLIKIVGPFQCVCCGHTRLMLRDWLNLRYLRRVSKDKKSSHSRRR